MTWRASVVFAVLVVACGGSSDGGDGGSAGAGGGGTGGAGVKCPASVCPCTEAGIRDAIDLGGGPYTFDCDGPTTVVTEAEIIIDNDVILDGDGKLTIDANGMHRVLSTFPSVETELRGLTVMGGAGTLTLKGGGILNTGTMTLTNSAVSDNTSSEVAAGIWNIGTLTLTNSTVSGNTAVGAAGIVNLGGELTLVNSTVSGNTATGGGGGGIVNEGGNALVKNSTVSGNAATAGSAGIGNSQTGTLTVIESTVSRNTTAGVGGGIGNDGMLTLFSSTVSGNTATRGGGGIHLGGNGAVRLVNSTVSGNAATDGDGGGIWKCNGTLTVANSTVSANSAALDGGGIFMICGDDGTTLTNSTLAGNTAGLGSSGISNLTDSRRIGPVTVVNSIVDGDCEGPVSSMGGNLESPGDTCGLDQQTDQVNVSAENLKLGPLQDNGGPTETHALLPGSVAIDVISGAICEEDADQRGEPRPGGTMCDVGAFEVQP